MFQLFLRIHSDIIEIYLQRTFFQSSLIQYLRGSVTVIERLLGIPNTMIQISQGGWKSDVVQRDLLMSAIFFSFLNLLRTCMFIYCVHWKILIDSGTVLFWRHCFWEL